MTYGSVEPAGAAVVEPVRRRARRRGIATAVAAVTAAALVAGVAVARRGSTAAAARTTEALRSHDGKTPHHDRSSSYHSSHEHSSHHHKSHDRDGVSVVDDYYSSEGYTVEQNHFLEEENVKDFLVAKGFSLSYSYSYGELDDYIPRSMTSTVTPSLVMGAIGEDALGGYVAFGLTAASGSVMTAGWLVVMDLYGNIVKISSTLGALIGTANVTAHKMYNPVALKPINSTHFITAFGKTGANLVGPRFLWNWCTDEYTELAGGNDNDAHDINWSYDGNRFWQMDGDTELKEWEAYGTGRAVDRVKTHHMSDPNHAQLCEDDTVAYISSRMTDGIVKVNVTTGDVIWTLGGRHGDYDIVDFDGTRYSSGVRLWVGQHNAEYFGDSEYCMFDNELQTGNNSRMLCVVLDEVNEYAYLSWEYEFNENSPHFGDNDRLPTGNMLGCYWPDTQLYGSVEYDERAVEITRPGGEIAWQLEVMGAVCTATEGECDRSTGDGWTFYSIERFYTAPLVYNLTCSVGTLSFSTHNNFKQSNPSPARYALSGALGSLGSGTFDFTPHWRDTFVSVDASGLDGDVNLTVTNTWGDETTKIVACSY